jgi:hypothetical protein
MAIGKPTRTGASPIPSPMPSGSTIATTIATTNDPTT